MQANFTGKQLHTLMVKNNKSLKDSASALGISLEEMQSYLEYERFDLDFIDNIITKLGLQNITEVPGEPNAITQAAFESLQSNDKTIEGFKKLLDEEIALNEKKQNLIIDQLVKMEDLYGIIEKHLPQTFVKEAMNENYQFVRNYLKKAGDNLSGPLKISGITLDETLTKFEYDDFDFAFIHEANHKSVDLLKIVEISNKTTQLTPAAFELLEAKEKILKKLQKLVVKGIVVIKKKDDLLINQLDKMLHLYVIIEKFLPEQWKEYSMEINYDFIRKFLKDARGYSF